MRLPVLFAGTARGLGIDSTRALTGNALTSYLKTRGQRLGYSGEIQFYSIRRRAGTDLERHVGADVAR